MVILDFYCASVLYLRRFVGPMIVKLLLSNGQAMAVIETWNDWCALSCIWCNNRIVYARRRLNTGTCKFHNLSRD